MASASARPFALAASASASPRARIPAASASYFARIPAASRSALYCSASAALCFTTSSASALFSAAYFSASAFFSTSATSSCWRTAASVLFSSVSRSALAMFAFTVAVWIVFCCSWFWISYAASASAFFTSETIFSSDFLISSSFLRFAISVSDSTLASFADFSACACAMATSRSACAFAIAASFLMRAVLSIPRSRIRPLSSVTFWMLQDRISIPSFFISLEAFSMTWSENESRSILIAFKESVPMISRILPWRESCRSLAICSGVLFRKFFAARRMPSSDGSILTFATASTLTLMKSFVGTDCSVLMSTDICPRYRTSFLSKNGSWMPARPIRILGLRPKPEMINALSGGALTYPSKNSKTTATTITIGIINLIANIISSTVLWFRFVFLIETCFFNNTIILFPC